MHWFLLSSLVMSFVSILLYYYYFRKGQFDEPEDVKYQLFRHEDDEQKGK